MKKEEAEQLSFYEIEATIEDSEDLTNKDQTALLHCYDMIMEFLEQGKNYEWVSTLLSREF